MVAPNCLNGRCDSAHLGDVKWIYHFTPFAQGTVGDLAFIIDYLCSNTHIHTPIDKPLGAKWGSVSWLGKLVRADWRSRGFNWGPSEKLTTCSTSWATDAPKTICWSKTNCRKQNMHSSSWFHSTVEVAKRTVGRDSVVKITLNLVKYALWHVKYQSLGLVTWLRTCLGWLGTWNLWL